MAFNLTAAVGIAAGSIGLIAGALIPKPAQRYAMAVVTGTTTPNPAMQEYVQKVDALLSESGCRYIVRQPATLLMEGDGGPLTVVTACPGKTLQDGISFYKSPAYQELIKLRKPYTTWDFRVVEGEF